MLQPAGDGGFPRLSEAGEVEGKHVLLNRAEGMHAAAKALFKESWAGEVSPSTKSAKCTRGDVEWQLCLALWQKRSHMVPATARPKVKHQLLHFLPRAQESNKPGSERDAADVDLL